MKIFSKFHDYYDIGLSHGQDETLVYSRNTHLVSEETSVNSYYKIKNVHPFNEFFVRGICRGTWMAYSSFFVGFCGKLYLCFELTYVHGSDSTKNRKQFCYSPQHVADFIYSLGDDSCVDYYEEEYDVAYRKYHFTLSLDCIENIYTDFNKTQNTYSEYFRKFSSPIFSVYRGYNPFQRRYELVFTVNPRLQDYEFYRVVDSFTAFQEVSMYLGGVLGRGEKETLGRKDFPDEPLIRDSKGFDKMSFKKQPTKKRF